jgi:hypothetical protein
MRDFGSTMTLGLHLTLSERHVLQIHRHQQ